MRVDTSRGAVAGVILALDSEAEPRAGYVLQAATLLAALLNERDAILRAEHELSDAYVRLRTLLGPYGALNTEAGGADRFERTEDAVRALIAQVKDSRKALFEANRMIAHIAKNRRKSGVRPSRGTTP